MGRVNLQHLPIETSAECAVVSSSVQFSLLLSVQTRLVVKVVMFVFVSGLRSAVISDQISVRYAGFGPGLTRSFSYSRLPAADCIR